MYVQFFFFNDTATTEIYTLSLHDALPICSEVEIFRRGDEIVLREKAGGMVRVLDLLADRKSTRLNSSHGYISYAVFCLKKKNKLLATLTPHLALLTRTVVPSFRTRPTQTP